MSALLNLFPNDVRSNGESFYYGSETLITTVKEGKKPVIEAHVGEERVYGVRLEGTASGVVLTCSCGEVTSTRACPHMWATLLESMSDSIGEKWLRKRFNRDVIQALEDVVDPEFDDDDYVGEEIGPPASWDKSASQPRSYSAEFSDTSANSRKSHSSGFPDTPLSLHESHSPQSSGTPASRSLSNLHAPPSSTSPYAPPQSRSTPPAWQGALRSVEMYGAMGSHYRGTSTRESAQPLTVYFLVRPSWLAEMPVELEILGQRKNTRGWGKRKPVPIRHSDLALIDSEEDAAILRRLTGSRDSRIPDELGSQTGFLVAVRCLRRDCSRHRVSRPAARDSAGGQDRPVALAQPLPSVRLRRGARGPAHLGFRRSMESGNRIGTSRIRKRLYDQGWPGSR